MPTDSTIEKPKRTTKSKHVTATSSLSTGSKHQKASDSKLSRNKESNEVVGGATEGQDPVPNDFMAFMKFACARYEVDAHLVFEVKFEEWKTASEKKSKHRVSQRSLPTTIEADLPDLNPLRKDSTLGRRPVKIAISFNKNDKLQRIDIKEEVPREIINLIGLIGVYHPMLFSISLKGIQNKYVIFEVSKLLTLTNITEVILDNVENECGNYYVILDHPGLLTCFTVTRCGVNDLILKEIAHRLQYDTPAGKVVKYLNLSCNVITDKGALYLAHLLRTNLTIFYLNLSGNQITDKGAIPILNSLMEFQVTKQELKDTSRIYFDYLNEKNKAVKEFMAAVKLQPKQKDVKTDKIKKVVIKKEKAPPKDNKKTAVKEKEPPTDDDKDNDIYQQFLLAEQALNYPPFDHAYQKSRLIIRGKRTYCVGNTSLTGLNLAYNSLTHVSVKKIRQVIEYRGTLDNPNYRVLVRISVEGNLLGPSVDLYVIDKNIEDIIEKLSVNKSKIKSNKSSARPSNSEFPRRLSRN